jgi:hypothetical protein
MDLVLKTILTENGPNGAGERLDRMKAPQGIKIESDEPSAPEYALRHRSEIFLLDLTNSFV